MDPGAYGNTTPLELLPFNSPASHALFEYGRQLGARAGRSLPTTWSPRWSRPRWTAIA